MPDEPDEYALVMPFTVVASVGGPYDDDAFAAGFTAGRIDCLLLNGIEFEGPVQLRPARQEAPDA